MCYGIYPTVKIRSYQSLKRNYKQSPLLIDPKHYILLYFSMHL